MIERLKKQFYHPKVVTLFISIVAFSMIYLFLDDENFSGVNYIKETIKKTSLKNRGILPGDVVLINTGWSDNYQDPDVLKVYYQKQK